MLATPTDPFSELVSVTKHPKTAIVAATIGLVISLIGIAYTLLPKTTAGLAPLPTIVDVSEILIVHVTGQVQAPGVYQMKNTGIPPRVQDALEAAGGPTETADRDYIAKHLNLAKKISDGEKIYIPAIGESITSPTMEEKINGTKSININLASAKEIETLPGIGAVRAKIIVDNRPYATLEELQEKNKLPQSVMEKIKTEISF